MQQSVVRKGKTDCLHLFFAGWGMDNRFVHYLPQQDDDLLLAFDYTDLTFDRKVLNRYNSFKLTAWSMGVWASEQIELPSLVEAIAVNGTPRPIDNRWGIPRAVFEGTLNNLSELSLGRFYRRMCGSTQTLQRFLAHAPQRSMESLREELAQIGERSISPSPFPKRWDRAWIGSRDLIFPSDNQFNYWGENARSVELPHFIW